MATSPPLPAAAPIADLLAALDDSDDERGDTFYYKPDLDDSPEKPSNGSNKAALSLVLTPQTQPNSSPSGDADSWNTGRTNKGPSPTMSRSTTLVDPPRSRPFTRVASVPAATFKRTSDPMDQKLIDLPESRLEAPKRSSVDEQPLDPETPALGPYARRLVSTVSRTQAPSSLTRPRDFPSTTPGLSSRFSSFSSANKVLGRRTGSNSPTTTPESDGVLSTSEKDSSPESNILSPRISPTNPSGGYVRARVTSGRLAGGLGTAPPVRTRKVGAPAVNPVVEESEEDNRADRRRAIEVERELRRLSLEKRLERERLEEEQEKGADTEQEMDAVEHELTQEREMIERDRMREQDRRREGRMSPPARRSGQYESPMNDRVDGSPTQRDYGHVMQSQAPGRTRSASSAEHQQGTSRPPSSLANHPDPGPPQRSASSLDHYAGARAVALPKAGALGKPLRPGMAPSLSVTAVEQAEAARPKARVSRLVSESAGASNSLRPTAVLSRQGSAPASALAASTAATSTPGSHLLGRHKRNPSVPSPPTTSNRLRIGASGEHMRNDAFAKENDAPARSSAAPAPADVDDGHLKEVTNRERDDPRSQAKLEKEIPESQQSQQQVPPLAQQVMFDPSLQQQGRKTNPIITVHRKVYQRLECIGKGGSSRVYRVVSPDNAIYAIKRVSLENADQATIESYKNEIALLRRLEGNKRIIRLIEFDSTSSKKNLLMVMECGEVDLAKLLTEKQGEPVDFPWVTSYWHQMLQAVQVIHDEKIVHSDLKPANFVLVKGSLKLIDFGIAKAIPNDTTNIQREQQIGTVNYMSPEAIQGTHGMTGARVMKLGRASDVWSLGCIIYQMIYGHPPFYFLTMWQKMTAIPDANHAIEFPAVAVPTIPGPRDPQTGQAGPPQRLMEHATPIPPGIIATMKACLQRDPKARPSIPDLLAEKWNMGESEPPPSRPISPTPLLRPDEAIIDDNMMAQLITYVLNNVPRDATQPQIRDMIKSLRPRLQEARRHRTS